MSTDKQIAANRANAQQSTGPNTEAGKSASSQNAAKHSLTSKYLIIRTGEEAAFAELESGLRAELKPTGALSEVIFKRVIECAWNLERCRLADYELHEENGLENEPLNSGRAAFHHDRIQRYARETESSMYKAIRELGKLQTEQQYRLEAFKLTPEQAINPEALAATPHSISPLCSLTQVMKNLITYRKNSEPAFPVEDDGLEEIARLHMLKNFPRNEADSRGMRPLQTNAAAA